MKEDKIICKLCSKKEAKAKNSHIIPSFLSSMVASYDQSYKRDKELLFKIQPYKEQIYIGGLPDTKLESIFDYPELTEERIKKELSNNPVALDYIFCKECENCLAKYLEGPYSETLFRNKKIDPIEQIIFWFSVVWRMSVTNDYGFKLPNEVENNLRETLDEYFEKKARNIDIKTIEEKLNFNYRIIHIPNYCKTQGGFIYAEYDNERNILSFIIGDLSVCITFEKIDIPKDYEFYGLDDHFRNSPNNNGRSLEERKIITEQEYKRTIDLFVKKAAKYKREEYIEIIDRLWLYSGNNNIMPIKMKLKFLEMLVDENVKIGERRTVKRILEIYYLLIHDVMLWF